MSEEKRGALQSPADAARTTNTIVRHVQPIGPDGSPSPSGADAPNAQFNNSNITNPEYAQVLDAEPLTAVTVVGSSTAIDVSIYDFITVYVDATSVTTGGIFTFQSSPQAAATDALWATVASTGSNDTSAETQTIAADGMFMFEIDVRKMHYFRPNLTTRTDGTYTVTVVG